MGISDYKQTRLRLRLTVRDPPNHTSSLRVKLHSESNDEHPTFLIPWGYQLETQHAGCNNTLVMLYTHVNRSNFYYLIYGHGSF